MVGIEAFVLLHVLGLGYAHIVLHDYIVFRQLAFNMLDRGVFSQSSIPPFEPTLFRPPGYPGFLALVYLIAPRTLMAVAVAQFLLLGVTAWLLYLLARHYAGHRAALIAALLCTTYPPVVFMAPVLQTHIPSIALITAAMLLVHHSLNRPEHSIALSALGGVCFGLLTLVRPGFSLIIVPCAVALLLAKPPGRPGRSAAITLALLAGCATVTAPWLMRNAIVTGRAANFSSAGGWSLWVSAEQYAGRISYKVLLPEWDVIVARYNRSNVEAAQALPEPLGGQPPGNPRLAAQREVIADRILLREAVQGFAGIGVLQYLRHAPKRFAYLWSTADVSPWQTGWFHRYQQLQHLILMLLVLAGCYLVRKELRRHWLLWLPAVYLTALHFVFHMEPRYTVEGRVFLLVYAGIAIDRMLARLKTAQPAGVESP